MRGSAPSRPAFAATSSGGFLAYGRYHYVGASKREGDWFVLGIASNKAYISLYASPVGVEPWADRLPKANLGRGCIRFKRTADLDLDVIDEVIAAAAAKDGAVVQAGRA